MPLSQGRALIPASGSVRLANAVASRSFAIAAPSGNSGTVYLGPSGVTSSTGFPLAPGSNVTIDGSGLDDLWAIGTNGDTLRWIAAA